MSGLVRWFLSLRPWVVVVTRHGEATQIFAEFWRKDEASRTQQIAASSKGFNDGPQPVYELLSRSEWNARQLRG